MNLGSRILLREDQKIYINHVTHSMNSADISIFSPQIGYFCYIKKYSHFFGVFKSCFNKHGCDFDDDSKIGYPKPS